jgi:hypothetical protein
MFMGQRSDHAFSVFLTALGSHKAIESALVIGHKLLKLRTGGIYRVTWWDHLGYAMTYAALVPAGFLIAFLFHTYLPSLTWLFEAFFTGLTAAFFLWTLKQEILPDLFQFILQRPHDWPRSLSAKEDENHHHHHHPHQEMDQDHSKKHKKHHKKKHKKHHHHHQEMDQVPCFSYAKRLGLLVTWLGTTWLMHPIFLIIGNWEQQRPWRFKLISRTLRPFKRVASFLFTFLYDAFFNAHSPHDPPPQA